MENNQVSAYLTDNLLARLNKHCKQAGKTKAGLIRRLLEKEMNNEGDQALAQAAMRPVNTMIGAYESGFVDTVECNLAQAYQIARNHCKDAYGIDVPDVIEAWGKELAMEIGLKENNRIKG